MSFEEILEAIVRKVIREELDTRSSSPSGDPRSDVLTILEAAKLIHVHPNTLRRAIKIASLPALQIGSVYRIRREDLDEWMKSSRRKSKDTLNHRLDTLMLRQRRKLVG